MGDLPFIAVGGGLAGAAFALELARNGAPAAVLEATHGPSHKVCGEFLSAEAQALLAYLGIDLDAMGATGVTTFRLATGDRYAEAPLPFRGAGLSRHRLDEALLRAAMTAGATVERGVSVNVIAAADGRIIVKAGERRFEAKAVALATGKHALRQFPRRAADMVGFKIQLRVTPAALARLQDVVQIVLIDGGYVGACLVEDALVTLCWVLRPASLQRIGASWLAQAAYFAQQSEFLRVLLQDAQPEWAKPVAVAGIPYGYLRRQPISPAIFPLGDQLAVIPSFTGDGMAIALYSGIAAAQAVLAGKGAAHFQNAAIGRLAAQFRWAGAVNMLFDSRATHGLSVAAARALPGVVTWIAQSTRLRGFEEVMESGTMGGVSV